MLEIIASSVLQWIDDNKGEKFFQVIKQSEFDSFQCAVDGSETGMAGLPINGKRYHLTAKTRQQMEKLGFTYMEMANINDIPTSPKIASFVLQIEVVGKNKGEYKVIKPPEQLGLFRTAVTSIIGRVIDGKKYSLVAKKPWQMEKLGFEFAGIANLKKVPRLK